MSHCDDRPMMTQELQVSILAAPLAAMDRRALSQAWYSALGIAASATLGAGNRKTGGRAANARPRALPATMLAGRTASFGHSSALRAVKDVAGPADDLARVMQRALLAKRIEQTFARMTAPPKRATFSMGRGGARVHVILQTSPAGVVLLALCRPDMRAVVAHALGQARTALAARGIILDLRRLGDLVCS